MMGAIMHSFDVELAKEYGVECAIIIQNLAYWVQKNAANDKSYHDGRYWTYNSIKAFAKLFPYYTEKQISYALEKLKKAGIIMTGNYNKVAYDRTLWYAFTDFGISILQKRNFHLTKLENGNDNSVEPIPNINTNISPDGKPKAITNVIEEPSENGAEIVDKVDKKTPAKAEYGNSEINRLFKSWAETCGFEIKSKVKLNRFACQRLIKSRGIQAIENVLKVLPETFTDPYAPMVKNFMDLEEKWDNLRIWYGKRYAKTQSRKEIKDGVEYTYDSSGNIVGVKL